MPLSPDELPVMKALAEYPLKSGQMMLLGPLSIAYLRGDVLKAPWLFDAKRYPAPGGKLLPDKHIFEKQEWHHA